MRRRVARNADVLDGFDPDSRSLQAILNRLCRKAGAVLHAIEALFLDSGDNSAVFDQRGRRVPVISVNAENVHRAVPVRYACGSAARPPTAHFFRRRASIKRTAKMLSAV